VTLELICSYLNPRFFRSKEAREWIAAAGAAATGARGAAIETVVRELLQIVVIDLTMDENAQEIFETLKPRVRSLRPPTSSRTSFFSGCSTLDTPVAFRLTDER
jgi:hypothetical protein